MSPQAVLWTAAAASAGLAALATAAEWLRSRRRSLDKVGWMPWQGISVAAFFAAVALAGLAANLRSG